MEVGEIYKPTDDRWRIELKEPGRIYVFEIGDAVRLALAILWSVVKWRLGHTTSPDSEPK